MKALKAFIKPFEVSQSVIIKVKFNLIFISIQFQCTGLKGLRVIRPEATVVMGILEEMTLVLTQL